MTALGSTDVKKKKDEEEEEALLYIKSPVGVQFLRDPENFFSVRDIHMG